MAVLALSARTAQAAFWYVDANAPTSGAVGTQAHPYVKIQDAVNNPLVGANDVIRVGGGSTATPKVYKPTSQGTSIQLKDRVRIEGGYPGWNGSTFVDTGRDPDTYVTVLSGDLDNDDTPGNIRTNRGDNAFHVVTAPSDMQPFNSANVALQANLDGFTIIGGHGTSNGGGGAIFIRESLNSATRPVIRNCIITDNYGVQYGGAVYAEQFAEPVFRRCRFIANKCDGSGGGLGADAVIIRLLDCVFDSNVARRGGAAVIEKSEVTFVSCKFLENVATGSVSTAGSGRRAGIGLGCRPDRDHQLPVYREPGAK